MEPTFRIFREKTEEEWAIIQEEMTRYFEANDPLYQALPVEDRAVVFTPELKAIAKGERYSTKDVADLFNQLSWLKERGVELTDAGIRSWFHTVEGLEEYVAPYKTGRNRSYDIDSVVRIKLLCIWRYVKRHSLLQIRDMIYQGELPKEEEFAIISKEKIEEYMSEYRNEIIQSLAQQIGSALDLYEKEMVHLREKIESLEGDIVRLKEENEAYQKKAEEAKSILFTAITARRRLKALAEEEWLKKGEERFMRRFLGLIKTEDEKAKETFIQSYIEAHIVDWIKKEMEGEKEDETKDTEVPD